jgi:bifunctional DNA-binding transcriptional regulator/antitoxin component of YhaV-PrlF toxin-antitoxin module
VGWGVGVGEKVKIDERWRIVIPKKYRKGLKPKDELIVERRRSEIVLRKKAKRDIISKFSEVKLLVDEELKNVGAEEGKHRYGGYKE